MDNVSWVLTTLQAPVCYLTESIQWPWRIWHHDPHLIKERRGARDRNSERPTAADRQSLQSMARLLWEPQTESGQQDFSVPSWVWAGALAVTLVTLKFISLASASVYLSYKPRGSYNIERPFALVITIRWFCRYYPFSCCPRVHQSANTHWRGVSASSSDKEGNHHGAPLIGSSHANLYFAWLWHFAMSGVSPWDFPGRPDWPLICFRCHLAIPQMVVAVAMTT